MSWRRPRKPLPPPGALEQLALGEIPAGRGRRHVPIVWLVLASHLRWGSETNRKVFVSNETLAHEAGAPLRAVEYALARLREAGKISVRYGYRGKFGWGRIIELELVGPNPVVKVPSPERMRGLWARARRVRERPVALVALALAAYVAAAAEHRGKVGRSKSCSATVALLCRLTGSGRGHTLQARLAALEAIGVLQKAGETWRGGWVLWAWWAVKAVVRVVRDLALPEPQLSRVEGAEAMAAMSAAFAALYG